MLSVLDCNGLINGYRCGWMVEGIRGGPSVSSEFKFKYIQWANFYPVCTPTPPRFAYNPAMASGPRQALTYIGRQNGQILVNRNGLSRPYRNRLNFPNPEKVNLKRKWAIPGPGITRLRAEVNWKCMALGVMGTIVCVSVWVMKIHRTGGRI